MRDPYSSSEAPTSDASRHAGTPFALYKQHAMLAFVEKGYSVDWSLDDSPNVEISLLGTPHDLQETRAYVNFSNVHVPEGLYGGRIREITITSSGAAHVRHLFSTHVYSSVAGRSEDRLAEFPKAQRLFDDVMTILG